MSVLHMDTKDYTKKIREMHQKIMIQPKSKGGMMLEEKM